MENLMELMLSTGQFMTVANVKAGGNLEDKIVAAGKTPVKISVNVSKVEKVKFDLRYSYDAEKRKGKFDFSKEFFESIPTLNTKDVGFSEFYIAGNNTTVLILCEKDVENNFGVTPKILNSKKGEHKSLGFVALSLEFYAQKSGLFPKNEEGTWLFNLPESSIPGVYEIKPVTIELTGSMENTSSDIVENIIEVPINTVVTSSYVQALAEEEVANMLQNENEIPAWVQADVAAEVTSKEKEEAINNSMIDYADQILATI